MAETLKELNKLTDEELEERYDRTARTTEYWGDHYLRILNWRRQERHTVSIKRLTRFITGLTVVVTVATVINVGILVYDVLK